MRILGIDPGLERTGYGMVEMPDGTGAPRLLEAGVIRTSPKDTLAARLIEIQSGLAAVLAEFRPDAAAIEELYSHYAHPRTAILMGHARGTIYLTTAQAGVPITSYSATHIKKALVGSGHASKEQIQRAIQSHFRLRRAPEPPDVADALAVALCHAQRKARQAGKDSFYPSPLAGEGRVRGLRQTKHPLAPVPSPTMGRGKKGAAGRRPSAQKVCES